MSLSQTKLSYADCWDINNPFYVMLFSNKKKSEPKKSRNSIKKAKPKVHALGNKFPSVTLTPREAECMWHLLKGKTIRKVGLVLGLSPRTVEYYVDKIKQKAKCKQNRI